MNAGILIHYLTSEVIAVAEDENGFRVCTAQDDFVAELSLRGYHCEGAQVLEEVDNVQRVLVQGSGGVIGGRKG